MTGTPEVWVSMSKVSTSTSSSPNLRRERRVNGGWVEGGITSEGGGIHQATKHGETSRGDGKMADQ